MVVLTAAEKEELRGYHSTRKELDAALNYLLSDNDKFRLLVAAELRRVCALLSRKYDIPEASLLQAAQGGLAPEPPSKSKRKGNDLSSAPPESH